MNFYLQKYGFQNPVINHVPSVNLETIVVIPCFNEPDIIPSLNALNNADQPNAGVEILIVINHGEIHSEEIKAQNAKTIAQIEEWKSKTLLNFPFFILKAFDLPKKHAGVGLARKIGMDEAVARFHQIQKDGIILCFDADAICEPNYFLNIEKHFIKNPKSPGAALKFAHPLEGNEYEEKVYQGIVYYELFLRYYNQGLKYANLPFAFHTVGSSMAVRSSAYQKQGGMNKRKAGEDFYFLHKIIALGNFMEINDTCVIPSPRTSDRVPFGTGKAINDWMETEMDDYLTYDVRIWDLLREFVQTIPLLFEGKLENTPFYKNPIHQYFIKFLEINNFQEDLQGILKNSTDIHSFIKRFYAWLSAFRILKLVHYLRDEQFANQPIFEQAKGMALRNNFYADEADEKALLIRYREHEANHHS
ncbi:glycosyltransferase [Putridiphycobacter roseus]|nr:glycosyltransferase family 2 protein [Putridiphycobacter roseus]